MTHSVFAAGCPLQVAAGDHPLVAIVEPERVVVVEMPHGVAIAAIDLRREAEGVDVVWLGQPARLLVVSRLPDCTQVQLLEISHTGAVRICTEKRIEAARRLLAVNGGYALLAGSASAEILTRTEDTIAIHALAMRSAPGAAGGLGTQLVVALTGVIEIWDPVARVAKRRIKLARAAQLRSIGGSDRQIWMAAIAEPLRLEVVPLINGGQPRAHDLAEPVDSMAGHPKLDTVVCVGSDSGLVYVIDLDGRIPIRQIGHEAFGGRPIAVSLLAGRTPAIVGVAAGQPPRLVTLDGKPLAQWPTAALSTAPRAPTSEPAVSPIVFDSKLGHAVADAGPSPAAAASASIIGAATVLRPAGASGRSREPPVPSLEAGDVAATPHLTVSAGAGASAGFDDVRAWRQPHDADQPAATARSEPIAHRRDWRDDLLEQLRDGRIAALLPSPLMLTLLQRLELDRDRERALVPVIHALYAAHLLGRTGIAASEVAEILSGQPAPDRWREAFGEGVLGQIGLVRHRHSLLRLSAAALRVLDERPAKHGVVVGSAVGAPRRTAACVVGAHGVAIAERVAQRLGGAVLAMTSPPRSGGDLRRACLEARLRGAIALVPYPSLSSPCDEVAVYLTVSVEQAVATGHEILMD